MNPHCTTASITHATFAPRLLAAALTRARSAVEIQQRADARFVQGPKLPSVVARSGLSVSQLPSRLRVLEGLRREDSFAELIATFFSLEPDQTRFQFTTFRSSQRLNYELAI
jgi:hypothetical protein